MSSRKSEILHFDDSFLSKSYKVSAKKSTQELFLKILKSYAKFKGKLTCGFKYDMRDLVHFHPTTQKFEHFLLMGSFYPKYTRFELQNHRGVIFHHTEK